MTTETAITTTAEAITMMTDGRKHMKLRHEQKHQISRTEDLVLAGRLSKLFRRDSHAGPDGSYRVTSLYFDTPDDRALREKTEGFSRREKFRLRYYGTISASSVWKKNLRSAVCAESEAGVSPGSRRRRSWTDR